MLPTLFFILQNSNMKQTLITLLLILPVLLFSQVRKETFESYIQLVESSSEAKIYFTIMTITITDVDIMITIRESDGKESEILNTEVRWMVGMDNLRSIVRGYEIIYWPKLNKLYVNNIKGKVETTFYGQTPTLITIQK
jgi:hypothetical protein